MFIDLCRNAYQTIPFLRIRYIVELFSSKILLYTSEMINEICRYRGKFLHYTELSTLIPECCSLCTSYKMLQDIYHIKSYLLLVRTNDSTYHSHHCLFPIHVHLYRIFGTSCTLQLLVTDVLLYHLWSQSV